MAKKKDNYLVLNGRKYDLSRETVDNLTNKLQPKNLPVFQIDKFKAMLNHTHSLNPIRLAMGNSDILRNMNGTECMCSNNVQCHIYDIEEIKQIIIGLQTLVNYCENRKGD